MSGGPAMRTRSKLKKCDPHVQIFTEIIRLIGIDTWMDAKWPLNLTIPLSQTCKEVRAAVHSARMCASVRVRSMKSFVAARKYEIVELKLDPQRGVSLWSLNQNYAGESRLVSQLPLMSKLRRLNVKGNNIGSWAENQSFFDTLCSNCTGLTELDLSENEFSFESDIEMIEDMMQRLSCLRRLNLGFNQFDKDPMLSILSACALSTSLTDLNVSGNGACTAADIAGVDFGSTLKKLSLANCELGAGDYDGQGVADLIQFSNSLTHLDLSANMLVDEHIAGFTYVLPNTTWLTTLDLRNNSFGNVARGHLISNWNGEDRDLLLDPEDDHDGSTVEYDSENHQCTIA